MNRPLVFVQHGSSHHADHSGYARLLDFIPGEIIDDKSNALPYRIKKILASRFSTEAGIYNSSSVSKDLALAKRMMHSCGGIAHYLNGERDIRLSTLLKKWRRWYFTATFHKPPDILAQQIRDFRYIERLDGAIAVGQNQVEFLKEKIRSDAVEFIPHGVDTKFFTPGEEMWEPYTCLFVGQHLRDFQTLNESFSIIQKQIPQVRLRAILKKEYAHLLPQSERVEVLSGISDEAFRALYRRSALLLLPLNNVTACNSILEALACGVPVVSTDLEGNRGYLNKDSSILVSPKTAAGMAEAAIHLMQDETTNLRLRAGARRQSLNFSWEKVASSIEEYFRKWFGS